MFLCYSITYNEMIFAYVSVTSRWNSRRTDSSNPFSSSFCILGYRQKPFTLIPTGTYATSNNRTHFWTFPHSESIECYDLTLQENKTNNLKIRLHKNSRRGFLAQFKRLPPNKPEGPFFGRKSLTRAKRALRMNNSNAMKKSLNAIF